MRSAGERGRSSSRKKTLAEAPENRRRGRNGWSVPVGLTYNSQNWRQDSGVNWQLGYDVGYGFGWKMLIGSITPYYVNFWSGVDHYVYTDGTGAEYQLNVNNGNVWSSTQGNYVWFDATANVLHFKDGTFWVFGRASGGLEADAGTLYPTTIEDVNGNQIAITYQPGTGLSPNTTNSSSRIALIADVRAQVIYGATLATYRFTYNNNLPVPHLTGVTNTIGSAETYQLNYATANLNPPFTISDPNYTGWTTTQLTGMTTAGLPAYAFAYDTAGASELTSVTFPYGGELSWVYNTFQYSGSRYLREIQTRMLAVASSQPSTTWSYSLTRPDGANSVTMHTAMTLTDASGVGAKTWSFSGSSNPAWELGMVTGFVQSASAGGYVYSSDTYTWSQDPAGNPYISEKDSATDPGGSNAQTAKTTQTLDQFGNMTQSAVYPYNNASTPLNVYNSTYLTDSGYLANYIRNRALSTTLTTGGSTIALAQNYYDGKYSSFGEPTLPAWVQTHCNWS
jgi:hypothetical protein